MFLPRVEMNQHRLWLLTGVILAVAGCAESSRVPVDDADEGGSPRDARPSPDAMAGEREPEPLFSFYTCWSPSRTRIVVYVRGPRHPEESHLIRDRRIAFLFVNGERDNDNERKGFNPYSGPDHFRNYVWFFRHPDELPDGAEIGIARRWEYDPDLPEEPELIVGTFDADDILDECGYL